MGEEQDKSAEVLEEVAKAAAAKEAEAAKAKADAEAKSKSNESSEPVKKDQKTLDELIKDPKIREQIKSQRGWSDSQLDSSFQMAPMQERLSRYEIKEKYKDFDEHKEFIDKELQGIAIFDRTPQVMERLYFMAKGKSSIENPKKETNERKPGVVGERIHTPYPSPSSGGGEGGSGKASTLTEEEKYVADQLGVSHEGYEASKKGHRPDRPDSKKYIRPPAPYKVPQGGNSADQSLGILLKSRR